MAQNNETEWCLPLGTTGGDTFEWSMVKVVISLMCDRVLEGMDLEGVTPFMATTIRIIFVVLNKYRIA